MRSSQLVVLSKIRESARMGLTRKSRQAAGLSLAEVAVAVGVSPATILRWETGQRTPRGAAALRYARLHETLIQRDTELRDDAQV